MGELFAVALDYWWLVVGAWLIAGVAVGLVFGRMCDDVQPWGEQ